MKIDFPYGDMFPEAELPDRNLISIYTKKAIEPIEYEDAKDAVLAAMRNPIGTVRLEKLAKGRKNAVIIADDSPQTPIRIMAPAVTAKLEAAGITDITFIVANEMHRPLSEAEKIKKFGKKLFSKYPILDNTPKESLSLRDLGYTDNGTRMYVNNIAAAADVLVSLGQIAPSHIAGFTGGAETVLPGIAGEETISRLYWESGLLPECDLLGTSDNPIRSEMNLAAERAGLSFIVNAVVSPQGDIMGFFAGHPVKAFEEGTELAKNVFGAYFHEHADIVICSAFPEDDDLWQASKALYAAGLMVKKGGVIILVCPCYNGVSRYHPQAEEFGYRTEAETKAAIYNENLTDFAAFSHCVKVGRLIKEKASCIMVKNKIQRDTVIRLGFKYSVSPQRAVDRALKLKGPNARIAVLEQGGKTLPIYMHVSKF